MSSVFYSVDCEIARVNINPVAGDHIRIHFSGSKPLLRPAASPSAASAAVAASPAFQVDAGGIVLWRGEAVVGCVGAALCLLCGRGAAVVPLSWCLAAGGDGVEELNIIRGRSPLFPESRPVPASLGAAVSCPLGRPRGFTSGSLPSWGGRCCGRAGGGGLGVSLPRTPGVIFSIKLRAILAKVWAVG
jgi:hypothetical protein